MRNHRNRGIIHMRVATCTCEGHQHFVKVDFSEQSTAVENVDAGEGRTIILARQDRHAVMKILDGPSWAVSSGIIKNAPATTRSASIHLRQAAIPTITVF